MNQAVINSLFSALGRAAPDAVPDAGPAESWCDGLAATAAALRGSHLSAVLRLTASMLVGPVGAPPERSWLLRFLSLAGDEATGQLQAVWARVLAHELLRPGTVSRASLAVLAGLALDDAVRLSRLAQLAMGDFVARLDDEFMASRHLGEAEVGLMEEAGLLLPSEHRSKVFTSQVEDRFLTHLPYLDRVLRVEHPSPDRQLSFAVLRLSRAGAELASVLSVPGDLDYMIRVTALFRRLGFRVTHAEIVGRGSDRNQVSHLGFTEIVPFGSSG